MQKLLTLTAAAAVLATVMGFSGASQAEINYLTLDDNLVAYFPFDVEGDDPTLDEAPSDAVSNDGTLGNFAGADGDDPVYECDAADISPTPGNVCSLKFVAGEFVRVADDAELEPADVTVSVWVRNDGDPTFFDYILVKTLNSGFGSYALYTGSTGGLFFFASNAVKFFLSDDAGAGVWDGDWHHIAGVYDSSGPTVRLFVDGVEVGTANAGPAAISYASTAGFGDFNIGTHNDESAQFDWIGNIDEVRVYDRVLSDDEIAILATSFTITKTLDDALHIGDVTDLDIDVNENWRFDMTVTVENGGPGDLENVVAKDPLPGDIELGDRTSGDEQGVDTACDPLEGGTLGDPSVVASKGVVTGVAKGRTDKCILTWTIPDDDVDSGDPPVTLAITVSTDLNPKGVRDSFNTAFQEYTSAEATYCINKEVVLTGTIVVNTTEEDFRATSNGIEVPGASTGDVTNGSLTFDTLCDGTINP